MSGDVDYISSAEKGGEGGRGRSGARCGGGSCSRGCACCSGVVPFDVREKAQRGGAPHLLLGCVQEREVVVHVDGGDHVVVRHWRRRDAADGVSEELGKLLDKVRSATFSAMSAHSLPSSRHWLGSGAGA